MRAFVFLICAFWLAVVALAQFRPAPPWIRQGGVVNDASRLPADIPGGALAPGAIVSIDGLRFVPDATVEVATPRSVLQAQAAVGVEPQSIGQESHRIPPWRVAHAKSRLSSGRAPMPRQAPWRECARCRSLAWMP